MKLKIICYVRGLHDVRKIFTVSNLLKTWKPEVVCFQETKIERISTVIVWGLWGGYFTWCTVLPNSGTSGGIFSMWDKHVVECIDEAVGTFSIFRKFKFVLD